MLLAPIDSEIELKCRLSRSPSHHFSSPTRPEQCTETASACFRIGGGSLDTYRRRFAAQDASRPKALPIPSRSENVFFGFTKSAMGPAETNLILQGVRYSFLGNIFGVLIISGQGAMNPLKLPFHLNAPLAELADALDSKSSIRKDVPVRPREGALTSPV